MLSVYLVIQFDHGRTSRQCLIQAFSPATSALPLLFLAPLLTGALLSESSYQSCLNSIRGFICRVYANTSRVYQRLGCGYKIACDLGWMERIEKRSFSLMI